VVASAVKTGSGTSSNADDARDRAGKKSSASAAPDSGAAGHAAIGGVSGSHVAAIGGSAGAGARAVSAGGRGGAIDAGPTAGASKARQETPAPAQTAGSAPDAGAQTGAPDPGLISVEIEGDEGCGAFVQSVSASATVYTALFQGVQLVRDVARGELRDIDCTLTAHYKFPAGWALEPQSTIVRGYASTDESSSLRLELSAGIEPGVVSQQQTFHTSTSSDFKLIIDDSVGVSDGSVCGEDSADILVQVIASALSDGSALLQLDSADGRVTWRRCP
jgi:hypothetical protein